MAGEKQRVDAYLNTIDRLEPDIAMIDHDAGIASIAISLKRIADNSDAIRREVSRSAPIVCFSLAVTMPIMAFIMFVVLK